MVGVTVKFKGGMFEKDIRRLVQLQVEHEVLRKIEERVKRGGKGLGAQRNVVTGERSGFELTMTSTIGGRRWPRTKGTSWKRKNVGIMKSMAPRVANAATKRIAGELGA